MASAVMLQAKDGFILTSEIINSMKQLFGEKINVIELDNDMVEALQSELSRADTIKLKNIVKRLDNGELKFYSDDEISNRLSKKYSDTDNAIFISQK
ncbi:hypothetical protein [Campylobacter mucosalis]|uniref:hypothetical protein n=1 Tax=Campylobacter mucosalis TaxID=202 RepID=UPI0014701BC9|nr:hypothetical protein [Campylobacter mucosalis]